MADNPWALVKAGKLAEALSEYSKRYDETADENNLANRGLVLLNLGRYQDANEDFQSIIRLRGHRNDSDSLFFGASQWLLGRRDEAIATWQAGLGAEYTDAAGGVQLPCILMFAAAKIGESSLEKSCLQLLRKRWKPMVHKVWPGPLAGLYLGKVNPGSLEDFLSRQPTLRARQQCQADFHRSVMALRQNMIDRALISFQAAAENREALLEVERYLARGEVMLTSTHVPPAQ